MAVTLAMSPWARAGRAGISVVFVRLGPSRGLWDPATRTVYLNPDLRAADRERVLCHELDHADVDGLLTRARPSRLGAVRRRLTGR